MRREAPPLSPAVLGAERIVLRGLVQGVGMRPALARIAAKHALQGVIRNTDGGVEMLLEGSAQRLDQF